MRITPEQLNILESLKCERLSSNPDNLRLVDNFFNRRNSSLVQTLQNEAMEEDIDGSIAYYVVKDKDGNILFFFSLKSGSLYDSHLDTKVIQLLKSLNSFVQTSLLDPELTDKQRADLTSFQEKIRSHKGITKYDLDNLPKKKEDLFADLENELSKNVTHVGKTYSSIELVHFCANNEYDELWESYGLPYSIGIIVFWHFIVKIILQAKDLLGIQYLFLFAADLSDDGSLVGFYVLQGSFINQPYPINGNTTKLLDDNATYWGNQIQKQDGRCYGIACDEKFILVSEYGADGSDAELVILKRR